MTTNYLHNLSAKELMSILRHVQLGHDHLSKKLTKGDYKCLLSIGTLSNNQIAKIENDKQEKIGNVSVVVNVILTSCFGAWLGFNAFNESSITSIFAFVVIFAAIGFGLLTGYLSYTLTSKQAILSSRMQELYNVQRIIIEIITNKRQNKIEIVRKKIHTLLQNIQSELYKNNDTSEQRMIDNLTNLISCQIEQPYYNLIVKSFVNISTFTKKLKVEDKSKHSAEEDSFNSSDFILNNSLTNAAYIKILTKTDYTTKNQIPRVDTWLRSNIVGIWVGLLPTFLGSFASMFVFLNGLPALFSGLSLNFGFSTEAIYTLKESTLLLAFSISVYFAYSHIHSNYKAFKRTRQLESSENLISAKMVHMIELMSRLHYWSKIYREVQFINDLQVNSAYQLFKEEPFKATS